jgi:hypothetical protein
MFDRWYASELQAKLHRPYVHLLFGARQTGKSTLLNQLIPQDARHLILFLIEKKKEARHGYVICQCSRPLRLNDQITALPWFCL